MQMQLMQYIYTLLRDACILILSIGYNTKHLDTSDGIVLLMNMH